MKAKSNVHNEDGHTALTQSMWKRCAECIKALLEVGSKPDIKDNKSCTALMWAARCGRAEYVKALLEAGANPNVQDNEGKTALDLAKTAEIRKLLQ